MSLGRLSWRLSGVVATVALTVVLSAIDKPKLAVWGPLAAYIVLQEIIQLAAEYRRGGRLRGNEHVQRRILRLITDLAELCGRKFHFWVIDIYLPRRFVADGLRGAVKFVQHLGRKSPAPLKFVRELSFSLEDVRKIPRSVAGDHHLFGRSYCRRERLVWHMGTIVDLPSGEVRRGDPPELEVTELRRLYGAISINPIVNGLGSDCRGLLVVHVSPDVEYSTTAAGVFSQDTGQRRLSDACNDLYVELGRDSRPIIG